MKRILLLSWMAFALFACATPQQAPVTDESHQRWQQRQQQLAQFNQWSIRGRVALFVNDEVYNLGLGWRRARDHHDLTLETSLGQGIARVSKTPGQAEMTTPEGDTIYGDSAEQLLTQATNLTIPVEGLQSWITGIAHNRSLYLPDIDASGRAATLAQDGWKINYLEYAEVASTEQQALELPHKLYLKRDDNLRLKIVIDQWFDEDSESAPSLFPDFPE
jgi:outer membrane lipoprotein LolB